MRTGIKTAIMKTIYIYKHFSFLLRDSETWGKIRIALESKNLINELKEANEKNKVGSLFCSPHIISLKVWKNLLKYNPNNIGDWTLYNKKLHGTKRIEYLLIKDMVKLYGGKIKEWGGYCTSGSTEANIYSMWLGRNYLEQYYTKNKICIIKSSLTHYSIDKVADLLEINIYETPLNEKFWNIDVNYLRKTINKLTRNGYKGMLIPLTLGYTQTGTNDDYEEITKLLSNLEKKYNIKFFVWLDASLNGLVLPFTKKAFYPLNNPKIQTMTTDYHKAGMTPIPSGIVLYRKNLIRFIRKKIPYIVEDDTTLLGSRTGISSVSMYFLYKYLGHVGFKKKIKSSIIRKTDFKNIVRKKFPNVRIIDNNNGIYLGIVSKRCLPKKFRDKYGLFAKEKKFKFTSGEKSLFIYKVAFLHNN